MTDLTRRAEEAQAKRADQETRETQRERARAQARQAKSATKKQKERRKIERTALKWVRKRLGVEATVVGWDRHIVERVNCQAPGYGYRLELQLPDVPCKVVWHEPWKNQREPRKNRGLTLVCPDCSRLEDRDYGPQEWVVEQLADLSVALRRFEVHQSRGESKCQQAESA